jgi:hypothetical protein
MTIWTAIVVMDLILICALVYKDHARVVQLGSDEIRTPSRAVLRILMITPCLVVLIVSGWIAFVWRTDLFARIAHLFLLLGLWMPATWLTLRIVIQLRAKQFKSSLSSVGLLLAAIPVVFLTPIQNFHLIFDSIGFGFPLLVGLGSIIFTYVILFRLALHDHDLRFRSRNSVRL